MSEQPPPDQPAEPTGQAAWDTLSEKDLDEALSKASALAADLSQQLSAPDEHPPGAPLNPLETDRDSLDRELGQLGDLVAQTAHEIEGTAGPEEEPAAHEAACSEVPDFMAEFMSPPPAEPEPAPAAAAVTIMDDLTASPGETAASKAPVSIPGVVGAPITITIPATARRTEPSPSSSSPSTTAAGPAVDEELGALGPVATVLELMDRPFAWAPRSVRLVAGVVGALTLIAAAVVFILGRR